MSEGGSEGEQLRALAAARSHPLRNLLLNALSLEVSLGAEELAGVLQQPIRSIRYQLRILVDAGLVVVEREEHRRGASKHYYRLARPMVITDEHDAILPDGTRRRVALEILRLIFTDASAAVASGNFTKRSDRVTARVSGEVDSRGWAELAEIEKLALRRVEEVMARSRERLSNAGGDPIAVTTAMLLFERAAARPDRS